MLELGQKEGSWIGNEQSDQSNNPCIENGVKTHFQVGHIWRMEIGQVVVQGQLILNIKERLVDNEDNRS